MPPNLKTAVEDPEERRGWEDNGSASFIDIVIREDVVVNKRSTDGATNRRSSSSSTSSSSSHRARAMAKGNGNAWAEANDLQSNLHVDIGDRSFVLHKFPLISKSGKLNRMVFELRDPAKDRIALHDMPGGAVAFENAVRFLYGEGIQLTSGNVAALRCAAEFLGMNESLAGDGCSLVAKTEQHLNHVVVGSWKNSIAVLRSCSDLKPWAEELEIVRRCSESVAWKASTDPHGLRWSYSKPSSGGRDHAPRGWWFDDVCSLYIDTFSKVINAVTAKGMDYTMVAAVVVQYAEKWLGLTREAKASVTTKLSHDESSPKSIVVLSGVSLDGSTNAQIRKRAVLQGIVSLLPSQPDSISCKFLLKLLRTACAVNAGLMCKTDLASRIGTQLEKVSVDELLIPAFSPGSDGVYDIDVVQQIVESYLQEQSAGSPRVSPRGSAGKSSSSSGTSSGASTTSGSSVTTSSSDRSSVSGSSDSDTSSSVTGRSSISRSSISGPSVSGSSISGTSVSGTSISGTSISGTSISGTSISGTSTSGTSISGSSLSGTSVSGTSISGTSVSGTSISGTDISGTSISGTSVSGTSISGSSVTGTSVSGSGTSISRTTSSMSDTSGSSSDESTTTGTSSDESSVKLDNRFEKKFFATEGPTSRPQLPPTSSNLRVAQLLETYVEEVAKDSSIPLGKFVALADLFIEFPRESEDCVYRAIDTFLKSHPSLNDHERRRLCKLMDIQALSLNACMHAASNERLPLRVVVSVLFTEQVKLRNALTGVAVINDKGVDTSIRASSSSSGSREPYSSESSSEPLSSSTASTDTSTTSLSSATTSSSSSAYTLSIHNSHRSVHSVAPSVAPSAAPSAASSLLPGGLTVKDTLRGAISEIELLRVAVQEIEMVKARLGYMDVLHQEMENMNQKFMDLAHDYTGMTHQVEELTKASKHKGGWSSGWKKMTKSFNAKDHPDLQKGFTSEKHLKAAADTIPLYQQMNSLHSPDIVHLQNPRAPVQSPAKAPAVQAAARAPVQSAKTAATIQSSKAAATIQTARAPPQPTATPANIDKPSFTLQPLASLSRVHEPPSRILEAKVEPPVKVVVVPKLQETQKVAPQATTTAPPDSAPAPPPPKQREAPKDQPPSVAKLETKNTAPEVTTTTEVITKSSKTPDHRGHKSRTKHRANSSPPSEHHRSRHHDDTDASSISSGSSFSSTHSDRRHRHRDSSSGHRHHHRDDGSEETGHRSLGSHGHGGHKPPHRHRDDRSPDDRHRGHSSKDHHGHSSKDSGSRPSFTKHSSGHHSGHHSHGHSKPHHRSHHKSHHRKDYDSASSYSSDSASRPSRNRRHSSTL